MEQGEKQQQQPPKLMDTLTIVQSPRPRVSSVHSNQNRIQPSGKTATKAVKLPKKMLPAKRNTTNCCTQMCDILSRQIKQFFCQQICSVVMMIFIPILLWCNFMVVALITEDKQFPNFNLEKLKHPVYNVAYLNDNDEFYADFDTGEKQQLEFEPFMQFMNYTNTERVVERLETGEPIKVKSYQPGLDLTGPSNWIPAQCYASVDYKYNSTLIGIIKNGNQLEEDLLKQIKDIFQDQLKIGEFSEKLESFLSKVDLGSGEEEAAEGEEELDAGDENIFTIPEELINEAGGGPVDPAVIQPEKLGQFSYREFETKEDLFAYTQQEGYGWDPEIPSVCFAFQVQENEAKNSYEIEWLYRDQWPMMYVTQLRSDLEAAPNDNNLLMLAYSRAAYNGPNMMQVFAANSILQRQLQNPEAQIVMFTIPYQIMLYKTSPLNVMVRAFTSLYFFVTVIPLVVYTTMQVAKEKETGMRQLMFDNGLNPAIHFVSWLLFYTVLNLIISIFYVGSMGAIVYKDDSWVLLFLVAFLSIQSLFGLIWALQPFFKTARMAILVTGFFLFLSWYLSFVVDQKEPTLETSTQQTAALAPLTAVRLTLDNLSKMHYIYINMNFGNYDWKFNGWSMQIGIDMLIVDFLLWTSVGIILDILLNCLGQCLLRKKNIHGLNLQFENTNEGVIQITALKERANRSAPFYEITLEKSKITCMLGADVDQKTRLLEMIAGQRVCENGGVMVMKDSDFFVRGNKPRLHEYLVYRSAEVTLDDGLKAIDHLNMIAHLRGKQKSNETRVLCHKLLPKDAKVEFYSESQRQLLQTLIALASENSRILILDEPTLGLDPEQRGEIIKVLRRFKKHRYLLIKSSDQDLVSTLADEIINIGPNGAETIDLLQEDASKSSYKLIVEVEGGKASETLVRYLQKDTDELILEYTTDAQYHYIVPNLSKDLLLTKTQFMENNLQFLGLYSFEFSTLPKSFQPSEQLKDVQGLQVTNVNDKFEDSFEMQDNPVFHKATNQNLISEISQPDKHNDSKLVSYKQDNDGQDREEEQKEDQEPNPFSVELEQNKEMQELKQFMKQTNKKPTATYRGELFYDFKNQRAKPKFFGTQCCCIFFSRWKEHWNTKEKFLAVIIMPFLFTLLAWHFARYYKFEANESIVIEPDWFPLKNKILVNEKTQINNVDTKKWIERLPMYEEAFEPTYISTEGDENFYNFNAEVFDYCMNDANEYPWSYGSYQFYEMDEEKHQYKFVSYVNVTSPFVTQAFPQYMIESIMKTALNDDDFQIKFRQTPFPIPYDNLQLGSYLTAKSLSFVSILLTMSDHAAFWMTISGQAIGCVAFSWTILSSIILIWTMRDLQSERKHYQESQGQSAVAYWMAKFFHDLILFIPISLVALEMINQYDPHMEIAPTTLLLQPLATLPFLYVCAHMFTSELSAGVVLFCYSICVQFIAPHLIVALRINPNTEKTGDLITKLAQILPLEAPMSSFMFNSEVLYNLNRFRSQNTDGKGETIELDEDHESNGKLCIMMILIHCAAFWFILIFFIEFQLCKNQCCNSRMKKFVSFEDNDEFIGQMIKNQQQAPPAAEDEQSSESAQIIGDGEVNPGKLQLRFKRKQKPGQELAFKISNLSVSRGGRCCGIQWCKPGTKDHLVKDLSLEVQDRSKFAIIADSAQGKTTILSTLTGRRSAYHVQGVLKKQIGRGTPIYTTDTSKLDSDVLNEDLTLAQTVSYYANLGSIHEPHVQRMLLTFGLQRRQDCLVSALRVTERHLLKLILALAGSARTLILDEPFTGLTRDQTLKLVKILRQKHDCTLIVTARSKAEIELLQPHHILRILQPSPLNAVRSPRSEIPFSEALAASAIKGYMLSLRLKPFKPIPVVQSVVANVEIVEEDVEKEDAAQRVVTQQDMVDVASEEQMAEFFNNHMSILLKLIGKKRNVVRSAIQKLMKKLNLIPEVLAEIADMIHEDFDDQTAAAELVIKCQLIRSLFSLMEALCKRFGEVHLIDRQDEHAVIRVIFNESYRLKGVDDSFTDQNPVFSSVVEFVNTNDSMQAHARSCQYLSSSNWGASTLQELQQLSDHATQTHKVFCYSEQMKRIERHRADAGSRTSNLSARRSSGVMSSHVSINHV